MKLIDKEILLLKIDSKIEVAQKVFNDVPSSVIGGMIEGYTRTKKIINSLEVKEVDLEKSIDVDSMVTEYLKQYEEAGQTPFAMNIIGSAYRKGLEDMFRLKAQKGE